MRTYLIPVRNSDGSQTFLRVRGTSLSDARLRGSALVGAGQSIVGNPTEVIGADGSVNQEGVNSLQQNFPSFANLFQNTSASALEIINNITAFGSGGGVLDPGGGEDGTSGVGGGVPIGAGTAGAGATDPFSSETGTGGGGVAFRNALDQAGLGALRGVGRDVE